MKIWKPSKVKLAEDEALIAQQKKALDTLIEEKRALEHKVEALEAQNRDLIDRLSYYMGEYERRGERAYTSLKTISNLVEKVNKLHHEAADLRKKLQQLENESTEVWVLSVSNDPHVKRVGYDPRYTRFYITEEAALKGLEKYLSTGELEGGQE